MAELLDSDRVLSSILRADVDYADFRVVRGHGALVRIKDNETEASCAESFGMSCRVLMKGSWGFASSNLCSIKEAAKLLDKARRLSRLSSGKERLSEEQWPSGRVSVRPVARERPEDIDIGQKAARCVELGKRMTMNGISNTSVLLADSSSTKTFLNSQGAFIHEESITLYLSLSAVARSGSLIESGGERIGGRKGYELLHGAEERADEAAKKALRLLTAKHAKRGERTVVVDGEMAGVFAHEALGHAVEADAVLAKNSILESRLGATIGSELVSIVDDASVEGFGSYAYDDEGIRGQRKVLIEKGVLSRYLHSRSTAGEMGVRSTGNCRASSYADFPIVRMSNTFFAKGRHSHDDIFDIKDGIYLKGMNGGSVEPLTGTFVFTAEEGYEIKNGELGAPLRDAMLSGQILEALHGVDAVGKDFGSSPGFCGKMGQSVPVADGGPHMRIRRMLVG